MLGGVPFLASFENMIKAEAAIGIEPDAVRRLGALGVWVAEDAERLTQRLRLANAESERLVALEHWWRVAPRPMHRRRARFFIELGRAVIRRSRAGRVVALGGRVPPIIAWRELATLPQRWTAPVFQLKAADFIRRGIAAGPSLGVALRAAEQAWIAADFPTDRAALEAIADRATLEGQCPLRRSPNVCQIGCHDIRSRNDRSRRRATGAISAKRGRICAMTRRGRMCSTCISLPRQTKSSPRSALTNSTGKVRSRAKQQSG